MIAAQVGEKLVFCLSGNPFAAAATLEQYAVPALLRAAGRREEDCIPVHTRGRLTTGLFQAQQGNPLSAGPERWEAWWRSLARATRRRIPRAVCRP